MSVERRNALRTAELFAGVGGFRIGLQEAGHEVVWSNQWEPSTKVQHASDCYVSKFGGDGHSNADITTVMPRDVPDHQLLVGGFPCQDYSIATTHAQGIQGQKGVLWWHIHRLAKWKRPDYLLLENVDRVLKSPTAQRGRDFGVMLRCLANLGYRVEWRTLNAADYSFPQKRRRVFIFAAHERTPWGRLMAQRGGFSPYLGREGFFARGFPVRGETVLIEQEVNENVTLPRGLQDTSDEFTGIFENAGVMSDGSTWTKRLEPVKSPIATLGSMLEKDVPERYYVGEETLARWAYLKGPKAERRTASNGFRYDYSEGAMPFPERLDGPARTILTSEGGLSPSRFRHIVLDPQTNRYRVLTPREVERLMGFPPDWTIRLPERWRYLCMGNALVVGLVAQMGHVLALTVDDPTLAIAPCVGGHL